MNYFMRIIIRVVYTRWGQTIYPQDKALSYYYSHCTAGTHYTHFGREDYLCLPDNPE